MSATQKRITIIIGIILLLLLGVGLLYVFVFKNNGTDETNNETTSETEDNSDDNSDSPESNLEIPEYTLYTSDEAYEILLAEAKTWAIDAQISMLQGVTESVENTEERIFYGAEAGKYNFWVANLYSKSLGQTNSVMLDNKVASVGTPFDIDEMIVSAYDTMAYISNINTFITSVEAYEIAKAAGLADDVNIYQTYLMYDESLAGWYYRIDERSKTEVDEYETALLVEEYVINAVTGELVE